MRIRFGDKIYPIIDGGAGEYEGLATIHVIQNQVAFSTLEKAVKAGLDDIALINDEGEEIQSFEGYDAVRSMNKIFNLEFAGEIYPDVIKIELYRTNTDFYQNLIDRVNDAIGLVDDAIQQCENTAQRQEQTEIAAEVAAGDITDIQVALAEIFEQLVNISEAVTA